MSEITDVLAAIESLSSNGERMVLATVMAVRGSTYRRPGARLLIPEHGAPIGNITGGCLEVTVVESANAEVPSGTRLVVDPFAPELHGSLDDATLDAALRAAVAEQLTQERSQMRDLAPGVRAAAGETER